MSYQLAKPSGLLAPYVRQYWRVETFTPLNNSYTQRIVPAGLPELMFFKGRFPKVSVPKKRFEANVILSGQQKGFYDLNISQPFSLFSITFQPHGVMMFFDLSLSELYDLNVPLKFILKEETLRLEDSFACANSFDEKVTLAEAFLMNRLRKIRQNYDFERIRRCVNLISQERGVSNIDQLASIACLSRKQLERLFSGRIGTSPRQFMNIVRFQSAIGYKALNPECNFTSLAFHCGFYDQSHMNHEFKKMSGLTPREFFAGDDPVSDYFCQEGR